ncbi:DUF2735 domain-containing protein [Mesorhizobium australicum]|nr:DUF2735 domain-containing protein [Mesorhizobium australicum]
MSRPAKERIRPASAQAAKNAAFFAFACGFDNGSHHGPEPDPNCRIRMQKALRCDGCSKNDYKKGILIKLSAAPIWVILMFGISGVYMMTNNQSSQSATIIQFPVGGRAGFLARREQPAPVLQAPVVDVNGWYHDEAIRETEQAKKH